VDGSEISKTVGVFQIIVTEIKCFNRCEVYEAVNVLNFVTAENQFAEIREIL